MTHVSTVSLVTPGFCPFGAVIVFARGLLLVVMPNFQESAAPVSGVMLGYHLSGIRAKIGLRYELVAADEEEAGACL